MVIAVYGDIFRDLMMVIYFVVILWVFVVPVSTDLRILRRYTAEIFGKFVIYICESICGNPI